jgi:hypothetical protein
VKLPASSIIQKEKLTEYLLIRRSFDDKSIFLGKAGYSLYNWKQFENDIREQVLTQEANLIRNHPYGKIYEIRCELTGPNNRTLRVKTVWIIKHNETIPRFVTLLPDKE